eukprot:3786058-Rhodomonas_salina.2
MQCATTTGSRRARSSTGRGKSCGSTFSTERTWRIRCGEESATTKCTCTENHWGTFRGLRGTDAARRVCIEERVVTSLRGRFAGKSCRALCCGRSPGTSTARRCTRSKSSKASTSTV